MNRRGQNHSAISLMFGGSGTNVGWTLAQLIPLSYLLPLRSNGCDFPGPSQNLRRPGSQGLAHHTKDHSQATPKEALSNQADHHLLLQAYLTMLPTDLIRLRPVSVTQATRGTLGLQGERFKKKKLSYDTPRSMAGMWKAEFNFWSQSFLPITWVLRTKQCLRSSSKHL